MFQLTEKRRNVLEKTRKKVSFGNKRHLESVFYPRGSHTSGCLIRRRFQEEIRHFYGYSNDGKTPATRKPNNRSVSGYTMGLVLNVSEVAIFEEKK